MQVLNQEMAERGPPAPKQPTAHKPAKTKATDPPQQNLQPQPEPEVIVPPDQVPDPAPPVPQVQIPSTVTNPPVMYLI